MGTWHGGVITIPDVLELWGSEYHDSIPIFKTVHCLLSQPTKSLDSQLVQQKSTTMPPPSALSIRTSSVIRLIKEEASYHKEAVAQEKVIEKLEKEGGDEYELRQQVRLPR